MANKEEPMAKRGEHYQHVKRKSNYEVVGLASVQNANQVTIKEGDCLVIYRDGDGDWWAREQHEFADGRFKRVDNPQPDPNHVYAVRHGDKWHVVTASNRLEYGENKDEFCWCEQESTAMVMAGEDERIFLGLKS